MTQYFDPKNLARQMQVAEENVGLQLQLAEEQRKLAKLNADMQAMVQQATEAVLANLQVQPPTLTELPADAVPPSRAVVTPQAELPTPANPPSQPPAQPQPPEKPKNEPPKPPASKKSPPLWIRFGPMFLMIFGPITMCTLGVLVDTVARPQIAWTFGCVVCTPIFLAGVIWQAWNRKTTSKPANGNMPRSL